MFPRLKNFPRSGARALTHLLLALAFVFAAQSRAEAAGTLISAPGRVDMVHDAARDTLYITSGGSVLRYHLATNSFLAPFNLGGNLSGLDLSPDGDTLVVADRTRTEANIWVHVVDLKTGESRKANFPRAFMEGGTFTVAYGSDSRVLVTSTFEGSGWVTLRKLDPATGAWSDLKSLFPNSSSIGQDTMLAASGDRRVIGFAESNGSDGRWGKYDVAAHTIAHRTWYENGTSWFNYEIGVNKNGTQYAIPTYGGTFIYNSAYAKVATLGQYAGAQPIGVVYHPVEDLVYFPWTTTNEVRAFNTNTFAQVAAYNFEDTFRHNGNWAFQQGRMKMSRDGSLLLATVTGGVRFVRLYDALSAQDVSLATAENTPAVVTLSGSVGNGGALSYRVVTPPAHGTLSGSGANLVYTPDPNYAGTDSFTFKSVYGPAESAAATVSVEVIEDGGGAPTADDQSVAVDEDGSVAVALTGSDPEGSPVTFEVYDLPAHGTLSGTAPNLVYTPAPDFFGSDSFTFRVSDGAAATIGRVNVTINSVNDAPVVTGQSLSTDEDAPLSVTLAASDVDNSPLYFSFMVFSPPAHGTLSGTMPNLVYTPDANYHGPDSFGFKVSDGESDSNDAAVTINVRSVNDAPTASGQTVKVDEDTPAPVSLSGTDADGDAVTYTVVGPRHGSLSGTAPDLVYTPVANYSGYDSFTYRTSDGTASSPTVTIHIDIAAVNDAPTAVSQSLHTNEDRPLSFRLYGNDAETYPVTFTILSTPTHGTLTGPPTALVYTPEANYNGPDSFTFKTNDGTVDSAVATISLTVAPVNDAPVTSPRTVDVDEDASVPVTLTATDVEGDQLGFGVVSYPQHGALSGTIPNLSYKAAANYNGPDSFTFRAYDGASWSETVTVTINVAAVNDAPAAAAQTVTAGEDAAASFVLSGSDVDGDALSYTVVAGPTRGTLSGTAPNLVYTPAPNYNGPDSFTFRTSDGALSSAPATVSLVVGASNDAPVADPRSVALGEDSPAAVVLSGSDVDGDAVSYTVVTGPAHGTLTGTAPNLVYTPAPNYNGPDGFTFRVSDGSLTSAVATVSLAVNAVNDVPAAHGQALATNEDAGRPVTLTASDVDGDPLTYMLITAPQHGSLTGTVPNLVYTPAPNYSGPDSFTFVVFDGKAQSATATVSFNVAPVNDAPTAAGDAATVIRNSTAVNIAVLSNDGDVDGDVLTITAVTQSANGSITIAPGGKSVRYTPRRNYRGNDVFSYTVSDGRGGTATAAVTVVVK